MLITHDLGVVAEMCERVVVMYAGRKVEEAPVEEIFARPLHPYTRGLLGAVPKLGSSLVRRRARQAGGNPRPGAEPAAADRRVRVRRPLPDGDRSVQPRRAGDRDEGAGASGRLPLRRTPDGGMIEAKWRQFPSVAGGGGGMAACTRSDRPLLEVNDLKKHFPIHGGVLGQVTANVYAVDGVSFSHQLAARRCRWWASPAAASPPSARRSCGCIRRPTARCTWTASASTICRRAKLRPMRQRVQVVFQDPFSQLNPRMKVRDILAEPLINFGLAHGRRELTERVEPLMDKVQLPRDAISRFPHEFSGGQRQRIGIARALAPGADLIICDEAVSALDVSVKAQIINLLVDLQDELGLALLFISHDLATVEHLTHRVAVMYLGKIVELADRRTLFAKSHHPYTRALLSAVPVPDPTAKRQRIILTGDVPSPINPPSGCRFHTRCPFAFDRCRVEEPVLRPVRPGTCVGVPSGSCAGRPGGADGGLKRPGRCCHTGLRRRIRVSPARPAPSAASDAGSGTRDCSNVMGTLNAVLS